MTAVSERYEAAYKAFRKATVRGDGWPEALKAAIAELDGFDAAVKVDALTVRRDALASEIVPHSGRPARYWDFDKDIRAFIDRRIALEDEVAVLRKVAGGDV